MVQAVSRLRNYVHGQYLANANGESFPVLNPGTGEHLYDIEMSPLESLF